VRKRKRRKIKFLDFAILLKTCIALEQWSSVVIAVVHVAVTRSTTDDRYTHAHAQKGS